MKHYSTDIIRRLLLCLTGICLTCIASAIFYLVDLGADPFQVFAIAVHKKMGISYGQANMVLYSLIVLFFLFFKRAYIHIAMVVSVFAAGPCIDVFKEILSHAITNAQPIGVRALLGFLGCIILAIGCFLYLSADLGTSPPDGIGMYIVEKSKVPYGKIRVFTDMAFMGVGILLGGKVGITTVFAVLLTGPCISWMQRRRLQISGGEDSGLQSKIA